jgi:hypothetical protein
MERDPATEDGDIAEVVRGFLALQARNAAEENRPLTRGVHAKGVCARAVFEVLDVAEGRDHALAVRLARGIYARPGSYPATVRFSNADPNVNDDSGIERSGIGVGCRASSVRFRRCGCSSLPSRLPTEKADAPRITAFPGALKAMYIDVTNNSTADTTGMGRINRTVVRRGREPKCSYAPASTG